MNERGRRAPACFALLATLLVNVPLAIAAEKRPPRTDRYGDPLPEGAIARLGTARFRHSFFVSSVTFSPNGKIVASGGGSRGVCLWDFATGKLLHDFPASGDLQPVAFSPDNKIVATAGDVIRLRDVTTGKELRRLVGHQQWTLCVAFSPNGKLLASGSHDRLVRLWDVGTGQEVRRLEGHEESVGSVAFSPDGRSLLSGGSDKTIRVWDTMTGKKLRQLEGHQDAVLTIAFSPDGRIAASGSEDATIRVWEVKAGKQLRVLEKQGGRVPSLAFSPDGKVLAAGNYNRSIRLYDTTTWKELRSWTAHAFRPFALAFSPDGRTLASGAVFDCAVHFWDTATGKEVRSLGGHHGLIDGLAFSADGESVISWSRDKQVIFWDLATGGERSFVAGPRNGAWDAVALSPNGDILAVGGRMDRKLSLHERATGRELRTLATLPARPTAAEFSPDGKTLATASEDLIIRLWDVRTGKEMRQLKGQRDAIACLAFTADGKMLASGSEGRGGNLNGSILVWDVASGKQLRECQNRHWVCSVAFSPEGKMLASAGSTDGKARIWDVATGKELHSLAGGGESTYGVAFSADGRLLAVGSAEKDGTVWVHEVVTGQVVREFRGHRSWVGSAVFSANGRTLVTGAGDSTIVLWDVTGRSKDGRLPESRLAPQELEARWSELAGGDAAKAFQAIWSLVATPQQSVPLLKQHVHPVVPPDRRRIARLISDLDDKQFAVREKAAEELEKLGASAETALQKAFESHPSPEVRRRVEQLLQKLRGPITNSEMLRAYRSMMVLEQIGAPEAEAVLKELAKGDPEARLTQEAKAALDRLAKRFAR